MKNKKAKGKKMSLLTLSHIFILAGIIITGLGGFGSYYFGKKESDQKDAEFETKLNEIRTDTSSNVDMSKKIYQILVKTTEGPKKEWNSIRMIEVADWFGGEGIDYMYFVFKSSSGVIRGNLRINDTEEVYSFSTMTNTNLPIAVRNLYLLEKGHFRKFPTIEYKVTEKTDPFATLSIVMVGAHGIGEKDVIKIEKPVEMTDKK